jgi:hypothetical protein
MAINPVFDLVVFVEPVVNDVNQSTVAALIEIAAPLSGHPLAINDLMVFLSLLLQSGVPPENQWTQS